VQSRSILNKEECYEKAVSSAYMYNKYQVFVIGINIQRDIRQLKVFAAM